MEREPSPGGNGTLCVACGLNGVIPDLSVPENVHRWRRIEGAKRRLIYSLARLQLPLVPKAQDAERGLQFDSIEEHATDARPDPVTTTGHAHGIITLNIKEADDAAREQSRQAMGEPYRTVLGHFRHEIAHYYWDVLVSNTPALEGFRAMFGDETADYDAALKKHYADGAPADWATRFVSAYASCHPWEDWAETWAHYLHITDTLETARSFGVKVRHGTGGDSASANLIGIDPFEESDFQRVIAAWMPLTFALNSLNRSMGFRDVYPFVLSNPVIAKLTFIHNFLHGGPYTI